MSDHQPDGIGAYVESLVNSPTYGPQLVCHRVLPAVPRATAVPARPFPEHFNSRLRAIGIDAFYTHQAAAFDALGEGRDIIVATPTASGKSLIYHLPVLHSCTVESGNHALYLFPLKALAQDQRNGLAALQAAMSDEPEGTTPYAAIYDGDTSSAQRGRLRRQPPPVLITNPDMLHLSLLPYHDSWSSFFKRLRFVIIDEIHVYRGLFGSHMAWVLRRLQRIAAHYGSTPQFIMLSATIGNPGQLAEKLTGRTPLVIERSGAPVETKHMLFLNPWDSGAHVATKLLETALKRGLRTIVYSKSRKMTELITLWTKPRLGPLADKLSSYRAGFLPEDRREIERDLANGTLRGVISTSALELGIDIGDLDLCILVGYPGSVMATWQRSGRVGRAGRSSAVILISGEDALDQYFMRHPDDFFNRPPEQAALDPSNSRISQQHLHCAAAELPLQIDEPLLAGTPSAHDEIQALVERGVLLQDEAGSSYHPSRKYPQRLFDLRGGGLKLSIIHRRTGEIIGEIDASRALREAHTGAIYLHLSKTLEVIDLNLAAQEVLVDDCKPSYYTRPLAHKQTEIIARSAHKEIFGLTVCLGSLKVTETITGYQKINHFTNKPIATMALDLPEQVIETEGIWLNLPEASRRLLEDHQLHFMGAIHAVEHAMIAMFPLLILCDRNDIGGISCPYHEQTGGPSIFIYDGYQGGAGLAAQAFELIERLLVQTTATIDSCPCESGCPSCVHSPRCGSGNRPIDKHAAQRLLQAVVTGSLASSRRTGLANEKIVGSGTPPPDRPTTPPVISGRAALPDHWVVFDLETKRGADDVGGWGAVEKMGMSVGVVYDSQLDGFAAYLEDEVDQLIDHLAGADLVVGFNIIRFDYRVLAGATGRQLFARPSFDLLKEIEGRLGYRLSLSRLAEQTLGQPKSADGLQALRWYREGRIQQIVEYCRRDVQLTRDLFLFALDQGYLLFTNKAGATVRVPLSCDTVLTRLLSR